jgi:hypothetical protein
MPQRPAEYRMALLNRLRERLGELEAAILTRIYNDDAPIEAADPEYAEGLRAAVPIALEYCLTGIERGEASPPPIPTALLSQARMAARNGIPLDTVLRRYFAGYTVLGDVAIEEVEAVGLRRGAELKRLLRVLASSFDRLLTAVSEDYAREAAGRAKFSEQHRATQIQRLLAGEPLESSGLGYDFDAHHLGAIAKGPDAAEALRELASALDRRLLTLEREESTIWAWLGGRRRIDLEDLIGRAGALPPKVRLAIGEPGEGLPGWRLTHRQARAALPIALRGPEPLVRYSDVALLSSILEDDMLVTSLRELYLKPLEAERDGGEALRETLSAYFACDRNLSSAAAVIGVSRQAVAKRLGTAQERLGCLFGDTTELEVALRLLDNEPQPTVDSCHQFGTSRLA